MKKLIVLLTALLGVYAYGAHAADAPAGTLVTNTVDVQYTVSGSTQTQTASANFTVAQLVNVTVTWQNTSDVSVTAGSMDQALQFRVTNTGNGLDSFKLADVVAPPGSPSFIPAGCLIYFDTANTGIYSSSDVLYTSGTNDPSLHQNAAVNMLIVCNVPGTAADTSLGNMQLTATSKTASGTLGTVDTGGGVGGVDAIVGLTGGTGNSIGVYQVHQIAFAYVLSQSVVDPAGGSLVVSGSTVTYTLTVTPSGSATADSTVVTDPVPANTTFVTGSLLLNGTTVSAGTGDFNVTTPGAVTVKLGNIVGTTSAQIIKFQVTIN